jgi:hypothetical protein
MARGTIAFKEGFSVLGKNEIRGQAKQRKKKGNNAE